MLQKSASWAVKFLLAIGIATCRVHAQAPAPTVSPDAPQDVEIPAGFSGDPVAFFDDFSWRSFVALNWPAAEGVRGEPDRNKEFGAAADNVVWGTWKADHEVFQPGGMEPSPWDSFEAQSPDKFAAFKDAGRMKVLGGFGARGSDLQIEHFNQAGLQGQEKGALVGRNRTYVRYEVRINKEDFNFIRDGKFYLASNLPTTGQLVFPEGSGEIKAAWRLFTSSELQNPQLIKKYYTTEAVLVDPDGSRQPATIGLIGLHIVRRTASRPEWIWSTFEHVDNLDGADSTLLASNGASNENKLHPPIDENNLPDPNPDPVPVRRLRPIRNETIDTNAAYRSHAKVKDTVWSNYQLVLTQWPRTPAQTEQEFIAGFSAAYPAGAGNPSPGEAAGLSIANVTMETSALFQNNISCMLCHFMAGKEMHTEFVWTVPLRAFRANPEESAGVLRALRAKVEPLTKEFQEQ